MVAALALSACGGAEPQPAVLASPSPVRAPSEASAEVLSPECRIEAVRAEMLSVALPGQEPFAVSITDGALALVVTDDGRALDAEVEHPLRFTARAPIDELHLVTRVEGELAAGALHVVPPLPVLALARGERGVVAHLQLGRRSPAEGVELDVGPVPLPCESVIAPAEASSTATALPRHVTGGELRVASAVPLVLRPLRVAPSQLEVRPAHRDEFVPLFMMNREGESARVAIAFGDGTRLEGWVATSALREPSADEAARVERMVREEGSTPIDHAAIGAFEPTQAGVQVDEYVGPASLRPSSRVRVAPGEAQWAVSAAQPLEVRVRWQRGARYAEIVDLPGMWITPGRAWVERGDLAIPE